MRNEVKALIEEILVLNPKPTDVLVFRTAEDISADDMQAALDVANGVVDICQCKCIVLPHCITVAAEDKQKVIDYLNAMPEPAGMMVSTLEQTT